MGLIRRIFIFITGYAWLLLLAGPGLIGLSVWSQWKAEGDHAYTPREQLASIEGTVTGASEITVKRKRRTTKRYYEITVQPSAGGEEHKLRLDHSTPSGLVGAMIDEEVTVLFDTGDNNMVYEVSSEGQAVIPYEATQQRLLADAQSSAESFSGAGTWIAAIFLTLVGAFGVWANRALRRAQARAEEAVA